MAKILAVGIATLDIINSVDRYPAEDAEVRALSQRQCRGGNATNTLAVLSQLGHQCDWAGVLIDEPDSHTIVQDLLQYQINSQHCRRIAHGKMPTSYITLCQQSGSRTIVHHRDCPEFDFADFDSIDLSHYDWIHFEGRNIEQTALMLQKLRQQYPTLPCSLEVEKPRDDIESLFGYPTLLFFSQHYAQAHGYSSASALLSSLADNISATCTWGLDGAWGKQHKQIIHAPACPPDQVVDTLAAGDTFNAAMINALVSGLDIEIALTQACELAGRKCGQQGLTNLIV